MFRLYFGIRAFLSDPDTAETFDNGLAIIVWQVTSVTGNPLAGTMDCLAVAGFGLTKKILGG